MTSYYRRNSAKTVQEGFDLPQNQVENDQLAVNGKAGYSFSTNVNGNVELGFLQDRKLQTDIITRSIRVELRAQFTF